MNMENYRIILGVCLLSLGILSGGGRLLVAQQKDEQHTQPASDRLVIIKKQEVAVPDFEAQGYILAIGGGGEGIIGQLKGSQVVAIDISRRELEEAPPGPLKVVMDARDLNFLDSSFNTAASFFTLCYIKEADHEKVFQEIYRVLAAHGRFLIWDINFDKRGDEKKDMALVPLLVKLPDKEINTGYGVTWPEKAHDIAYYVQLAKNTGFDVKTQTSQDKWFFLELAKEAR